jgi:hypothetical protein
MLNIETKVDSAEKLAAVAGKPTENFLFAEELNKIVAKVNEIDGIVSNVIFLDETSTIADFQTGKTHYYIGEMATTYDYNNEPYPLPLPVSNFNFVNLSVFDVSFTSDGGNYLYTVKSGQALRDIAIIDSGFWEIGATEYIDNLYNLQEVTNKGSDTTNAIRVINSPNTYRTRYSTIGTQIQRDDLGFQLRYGDTGIILNRNIGNKTWSLQIPDITANANSSSFSVAFRPDLSGTVAYLSDLSLKLDASKYILEFMPTPSGYVGSFTPATVGTNSSTSPDFSTSNYLLRQFRRRLVSAATAGSTASFRDSSFRHTAIGDGFHSFFIFGNEDAAPVLDARCFCGFVGGNGSIGNVNPNTVNFIVGVGNSSGQANLSFIARGSGNYDQDLGVNFPANTTTDCYMLEMINQRGTSTLTYRVVNLQTNADTGYVVVPNSLPPSNIGLSPQIHRNNGTTALAVTVTLGLYRLIKL